MKQEKSMPHTKRLISFVALLATALACATPGFTSPERDAANTAAAETMIAGLTQSVTETFTPALAASLTPTFTPTLIYLTPRFPSETATHPITPGTDVPTLEGTFTPTMVPIEISVTRPTHCRAGPGKAFEIVGSFLVGMKAVALGRDTTNQFYYIPNPYVFTDYCWVSGKYAEFTGGDPVMLPVVTSPPTPTTTGTAIPSVDFRLRGSGFQGCNGVFWMNIEITNESSFVFQSVQVQLQDREKNLTRTLATDSFVAATGCGGLTVEDGVPKDAAVLVSSAKFDYNFKGHLMRAYVTVCTEDKLQGVCTTREVALNP
jgi:hypothetical protein